MFKLNSLTVKNFMSVGNSTQALDFNRNDLTLVIGENLDTGGGDHGARNGTLSIVDKQTSTDTTQLKLHSRSRSTTPGAGDIDEVPHIGDFASFVQGSGKSDEIKLSPNGPQNFLKLISKALKIQENGKVGVKFVVNQSYGNDLTRVSSDRSKKNLSLSNILSLTSLRSGSRKLKVQIEMSLNKFQNNSSNDSEKDKSIDGDVQYAE